MDAITMPRSGAAIPSPLQTSGELRARAARLRDIARDFPGYLASDRIIELAAELEAKANDLEPSKLDTADPWRGSESV